MKLRQDITSYSIKELETIIKKLSDAYYNQKPLVSDQTFDSLVDVLKAQSPDNVLLSKIGAPVRKDIKKAKLPVHMGSMGKKNTIKEIELWTSQYVPLYILSCKLDGVSGLYVFDKKVRLYTRGNGTIGQDITFLANYINLPSQNTPCIVRGEFIIKESIFEQKFSNLYPKSRTLVSSLINSKSPDPNILKYIDFVAYEQICDNYESFSTQFKNLKKDNFDVVEHMKTKVLSYDLLYETLRTYKETSPYEIDGIIVSSDQKYLRNTTGNPKYSFAFKVNSGHKAIVKDIIWNPSKYRTLIPKVELEPIIINGDTIRFSSGFNAKYIEKNKLGPGSEVIITKSGEVIPYIMEVTKSTKAKFPPYKYVWSESGLDIMLSKSNTEVEMKIMLHFFSTLEVPFISEGTVAKFFDNNYTKISQVYHATVDDFLTFEGVQEKTAQKIYNSVHSILDNKIDLAKLMHASMSFGFGLGTKRFQIVLNSYPDYKKVSLGQLEDLEGFSSKVSKIFLDGLDDFGYFMAENKYLKYTIEKNVVPEMTVVLTGFRDKVLEQKLEQKNIKISSSISKKVNLVIALDKEANSTKLKKARLLKIEIINLDQIDDYID